MAILMLLLRYLLLHTEPIWSCSLGNQKTWKNHSSSCGFVSSRLSRVLMFEIYLTTAVTQMGSSRSCRQDLINKLKTTRSNILTLYYMLDLFHNILETGRTLETNTTIETYINTLINFSFGKGKKNRHQVKSCLDLSHGDVSLAHNLYFPWHTVSLKLLSYAAIWVLYFICPCCYKTHPYGSKIRKKKWKGNRQAFRKFFVNWSVHLLLSSRFCKFPLGGGECKKVWEKITYFKS